MNLDVQIVNRTFKIYCSNAIENKFHFECVCLEYEYERYKLCQSISKDYHEFYNLDVEEKFSFGTQNLSDYINKNLEEKK